MYLNILEGDADNSTELMPEECTSSSRDEKQLAIKVFNAQLDLIKSHETDYSLSIQSRWWIKINKISM